MVVGSEQATMFVRRLVQLVVSLVGEGRRWVDKAGQVVVVEVSFGQMVLHIVGVQRKLEVLPLEWVLEERPEWLEVLVSVHYHWLIFQSI